ncbi:MAG: V-type ATP synthase subunit E family protein [Thermodesulfobacteriota bacterium]
MSDKGVDKIISHIQASVDKEISEVLHQARQEAEAIKKDAEQKADAEAERLLSQGKRIASLEGQKIIAETKLEFRRKKMDAQEEAIAASFEDAAKFLEELAEKQKQDSFVYKDIMFNLIGAACEILAGGKVELVLNSRDRKRFDKKMMGALESFVKEITGRDISLNLAEETMPCIGGVIVRDMENQIEVDNTFEAKLNRLKEGIRVDVAKLLFGEEL